MHPFNYFCFTKGNILLYNGCRLEGGVINRTVDEVKIPTTPSYSYYVGDQKKFVKNGTYPFGGITYYF